MRSALSRLIRPRSLERRLFLWLTLVALIPSLSVLAIASWAGREAAGWVGASGSWTRVAESGRVLIEEAERNGDDPELRAAAQAHRRQLSTSLTQARRWEFVGSRLRTMFPLFLLALGLFGSLIALGVARHVARQVSRPARELVNWTHLLADEEPLPQPEPREEREVKELRRLRAALRQASEDLRRERARELEAERVKSWGEMARRVAHEMKNPLTPLRLAAHRLQRAQRNAPELAEALTVIGEETQRLEELAASFAMLGRPAEGPRSAVDIRELLERLLASDVPSHVHVALQGEARAQLVEADYNALLQAFRNIVRNAVEAVEQNGRMRNITVSVSRADDRVRVSVRDTGPGLSEEAKLRLFEPDFTSKTKGTGLGLAVARQTIRVHGGDIVARNADSGGAEFIVELPLFEGTPDHV